MAISANTVLEVRGTGSDTNSGGFVTGASGTDWSQQDAAQYSVTDGVTNGTTTITSATANFGTDVVGNLIYVQGGTGSVAAAWYEIISRTNSTTIVVDRSTGLTAGTGVTLKIGGALASPGQAGGIKIAGNDIHIKSGTYTIGTGAVNTSGNKVSDTTGGSSTNPSRWIGYQTTRGDLGTKPILQAGGSTANIDIFAASATDITIDNIEVDGVSKTNVRGFNITTNVFRILRCRARNCTTIGFDLLSTNGFAAFCEATGCATTVAGFRVSGCNLFACVAHANSIPGFSCAGGRAKFVACIAYGNTGASSDGFADGSNLADFVNCTAYSNGRHGFNLGSGRGHTLYNCLAAGNAGYGYSTSAAAPDIVLVNCAGYNNTSGNYNASQVTNINSFQALTGDPFTNAAGGDFSLNNTAGAGAACRAAGMPGLFPAGLTTGYLDIGAAQHEDSGSGGTRAYASVG